MGCGWVRELRSLRWGALHLAGKDGKKRRNKKRDVNIWTKAGHGTDMDVFIDDVSTRHITSSTVAVHMCVCTGFVIS